MKIELISLHLENFKGVKNLDIDFGKNTEIHGRNESGKTTIMDSFFFLLFGKDSQGKSDFEIKTVNSSGDVIHNLNHSVSGSFLIDGEPLKLKKVYSEKWTKKRGETSKELTGHTTDHFIDSVPVQKKDFLSKVQSFIDEKMFKLSTDARYFNEMMPSKDRRNILTAMCGEIDETKISGYDAISLFKGNRTIEDHKKVISAHKKEINDQLQVIAPKIQENHRLITEDEPPNGRLQQGKLRGEQDELRRKITALKEDSGKAARQKEVAEIETEILKKQNSFTSDQNIKFGPVRDKIQVANASINKLRISIDGFNAGIKSNKNKLSVDVPRLDRIRQQWRDEDSKEQTLDNSCPTCFQDLPEHLVKDAKEKFNSDKSLELENLSKFGKDLAADIKKAKAENVEAQSEVDEKEKVISNLTKELHDLEVEETRINSTSVDTSGLEERKKGLLSAINQVIPPDTSELQSKIDAIDKEIDEERELLQKVENNKLYKVRIEELETDQSKLSQELADLEKKLVQIEEFIMHKTGMVETQVNNMFKIAKFKMFRKQINGGLEEICETMKDGVIYNSINNAGKIQVGIDIISTLQKFHGLEVPIWIDNREGVTNIPETKCQTISLFVSPSDKQLRITNGK